MNYEQAEKKLAELSANLLAKTLPKFLKKKLTPLPQDEGKATYTKKFKTDDGFVEYEKLKEAIEVGGKAAQEIDRKIRALSSEPGVYTIINEKRVKLLEVKLIPLPSDATCYTLHVSRVIPECKKPMTWEQLKSANK